MADAVRDALGAGVRPGNLATKLATSRNLTRPHHRRQSSLVDIGHRRIAFYRKTGRRARLLLRIRSIRRTSFPWSNCAARPGRRRRSFNVRAKYSVTSARRRSSQREIDVSCSTGCKPALLTEAFRLVQEGYVTPQDLDRTLADGLGLRWSFMGTVRNDRTERAGWHRGLLRALRAMVSALMWQTCRSPRVGRCAVENAADALGRGAEPEDVAAKSNGATNALRRWRPISARRSRTANATNEQAKENTS